MRLSTTLAFAAASATLILSSAAFAAPHTEMSDSALLAVAHCAGVAEGTGGDVAPFNAVIDSQAVARTPDVLDRLDQVRTDAKRAATHSGPDGKAALVRERDGVCRNYLQQG